MGRISEAIRVSRDRRVRYLIFNRRIFRSYAHNGIPAWTWSPYSGDNLHVRHMHVSVNDVHHDETQDWSIGSMDPKDEKAMSNRVRAMIRMQVKNPYGDDLKPEDNELAKAILALAETAAAHGAMLNAIRSSMADLVPILTSIQDSLRSLEGAPRIEVWTGEAQMVLKPQVPSGGA